jgi:hypothetical protein
MPATTDHSAGDSDLLPLPHGFPFRFIDLLPPDGAIVRLSSNSYTQRDGLPLPGPVLLEILAQAAQLLLASSRSREDKSKGTATRGYLAAIDNAQFSPLLQQDPLRPGDTLRARVTKTAQLGRLIKIHGTLFRLLPDGGEQEITMADLMLGH